MKRLTSMTVKELKELLADVPDHYEVRFEYDGMDAYTEVPACGIDYSESRAVLLIHANADEY
jgi:hypothetical protein